MSVMIPVIIFNIPILHIHGVSSCRSKNDRVNGENGDEKPLLHGHFFLSNCMESSNRESIKTTREYTGFFIIFYEGHS